MSPKFFRFLPPLKFYHLTFLICLPACGTLKTSPGPSIADTSIGGSTVQEIATQKFLKDFSTSSAAAANDTTAGLNMFNSGRAMLDLQCGRYIDAVGGANQVASNERKQVNLVGGLTSALMGIGGSTAKEISGVATSFSFVGSSMDAFTETYLFSDAAKSVGKIVSDSQAAYLAKIESDTPQFTHSNAVALLAGYQALCRPQQIRALIDEAVSKSTIVAENKTPQASDIQLVPIISGLAAIVGRPITEAEAITMYAWYTSPASRNNIQIKEPLLTLRKSMSDSDLSNKMAQIFSAPSFLSSAIPARWSLDAQKIIANQQPAAQPAAAPGAVHPELQQNQLRFLSVPVVRVQ